MLQKFLYIVVISLQLFNIQESFAQQQEEKKALSKDDSLARAIKMQKRSYTTQHTPTPPLINGLLDDEVWNKVEWATDFTQREPADGEAPTFQTAFKVLYDERNLYVAIRAYDSEPNQIARRMSRRDGFDGDFVELNIDSYNDKRTAFSFTLSASGVIGDEAISNNGDNWDSSWDPIWWAKTHVDELGWTAEIKIPLSQLRFTNSDDMTWGFQVLRMLFRKQERSYWQYIPQNSTGWVHLFGELNGLKGIKPQKQLEIMPYVVAKNDQFPVSEDDKNNPFVSGNESKITTGIDAKIGITSDITLDLTINPDFGQVEADPSQVNLTAFEVFFQERRPFFVESRNILDYQLSRGPIGGNFNTDNLVYSRRIGRNPSYTPDTDASGDDNVDEYVKKPNNTRILGAAKLTGKNQKGFSFGIMEAFTEKTYAKIDSLGHRSKETVEPFTNYFVARAQKDFNAGRTVIGGITTSVYRKIEDQNLDSLLNKEAYSTGIDFLHHFDKDRKYFISGDVVLSHIRGSANAITKVQKANPRVFQRPDAPHLELDTLRTSLTGHGGMLRIGKRGGGNFRYETGVTWRSPSLELNDIGFLRQADIVRHWIQVSYQQLKPTKYFRRLFSFVSIKDGWDFSRRNIYHGFNGEINVQMHNLWWIGLGAEAQLRWISNNDLRGGSSMKYPGGGWFWGWVDTNYAKKLAGSIGWSGFVPSKDFNHIFEIWGNLRLRVSNALEISFNPSIRKENNHLQFITNEEHNTTKETRTIVAKLDQKTVSAEIRINYIIRPNLSLQYYGQPFAFVSRYKDFKKIINGSDAQYHNRFELIPESNLRKNSDDDFDVDENLDGKTDYTIENPDFDFSQFRQNFVLRWEYIPGSVFFAVWAINGESTDYQNKTNIGNTAQFAADMTANAYNFSPLKAHHTFLIKYTYRFRF